MRRQILPSGILLLVFLIPVEAASRQVALVENGKSTYFISIATDASASEKHAAQELQRIIQEMSGARLPVVTDAVTVTGPFVLLGDSKRLKGLKPRLSLGQLGPEDFFLKSAPPHLVIAGGRPRGTLYGVYTFLEKLGCRWFSRDLSRIPRMPTIKIDSLDEIQKPAFEYREPYFTEAFDRNWAVRNKINGNSMQLDDSTGGQVKYYPFVHTFYEMLPPQKYFKEHPEYYSLIDGKRRFERGQLCLTNPDVLRLGIDSVTRWIIQHPEATIFSVSQNDWTGWCECDNCRRAEVEEGGEHSGPVLRYVNALAAEIERKYPEKLIDTLAYWYTEGAPLKARPRRNVRIRLCPIGVCEAHPYEKCDRSAYFMKNLRAWSRITNQLYIWHYNTNFSHYLVPFPDFDELAADIPMYRRHGVVGLFLEGAYPPQGGGENAELRSYLMARLLWDVNTDVNRAIEEFMQAAYGKASPFMHQYLELLHQQVRMPPEGRGTHIWIFNVPHYTDNFLAQAQELFRRAEEAAEIDSIRSRVRKARLSVDYLEYLKAKSFTMQDGWYAPPDMTKLASLFQALFINIRAFGITSIREGADLTVTEQEFASNIKSYRTLSLENENIRVSLAPELSGRILQIEDRRSGYNAIAPADSGDRNYPNLAGWSVAAYPDYHSRQPIEFTWQPGSNAGGAVLAASATSTTGLVLNRTIRLVGSDGTVQTLTTLQNSGNTPIDVALQSRIDLDPGDPDQAFVQYTRKDGKEVEIKLIQKEREPADNQTFLNSDQPDGEVHLLNRKDGRTIFVLFPAGQVGRSFISWSAKGIPRVVFGIWSPQTKLAPGEHLTLESSCRTSRK